MTRQKSAPRDEELHRGKRRDSLKGRNAPAPHTQPTILRLFSRGLSGSSAGLQVLITVFISLSRDKHTSFALDLICTACFEKCLTPKKQIQRTKIQNSTENCVHPRMHKNRDAFEIIFRPFFLSYSAIKSTSQQPSFNFVRARFIECVFVLLKSGRFSFVDRKFKIRKKKLFHDFQNLSEIVIITHKDQGN